MADIARWSDPKSYSGQWLQRAEIIAGYLSECQSVLDLGAGPQILKPLVKGYVPVDVVNLGQDTIQIDFDSEWNIQALPNTEGIAISGLLEHIADPLGLINKISGLGQVWAVSYMDKKKHRHQHLVTIEQLEQSFSDAGLKIAKQTVWRNQNVYKLIR